MCRRRKLAQRLGKAAARTASNPKLNREKRKSQQRKKREIHENERRAAVLAHDVREAPYIAQADCGTDRSFDSGPDGGPEC